MTGRERAIENKDYSQRRACGLVGLQPKTYRYATTRPDDGAAAVERAGFGTKAVRLPGNPLVAKKAKCDMVLHRAPASLPRTASSRA